MSEQTRNARKEERLAEQRSLEHKKLLVQLKKEIDKLEYEVNHAKAANLKIILLKHLKYCLRFGQMIAPYVATVGLTLGGSSLINYNPFVDETRQYNLETKTEIDTLGNFHQEQQYDEYESLQSEITMVGKWNKQEDGMYSRDIKTYMLKLDYDTVNDIIYHFDDYSLDDILDEPTFRKTEIQNNLTDEEINAGAYIKAILYSENKEDFVIKEETQKEKGDELLLWLLLTILVELAVLAWRNTVSNFDFKESIRLINLNNKLLDIEELKKKLEIKQSNYERLMR